MHSNAHLLVNQTRDLTLVTTGPLSVPATHVLDASSSMPSVLLTSPGSSLPCLSYHASREDIALRAGILNRTAEAQRPSLACTSRIYKEASTTLCQSPPGTEGRDIGISDLDKEEAVILMLGQGHGQATRAMAGQPGVGSAAVSCSEHASTASSKDADSASGPEWKVSEPEWKAEAMAKGTVTRRSSLATLVEGYGFSWDIRPNFDELPNEVLMHILSFLEVCDLLATSRQTFSWAILIICRVYPLFCNPYT
ncbi:hypothetical protein BJ170DRAFT_291129 [Xylariales sp. AK1849]|nr:hypothetical protein BJ170DRAFT_291129 [Xylariales sp. AK1849]